MARASRRAGLSTLVPKTAIEQATSTLQELPEKPKEELSLKEAIQSMRDSISAALSKGYSLDEVAEMLTDQGVSITSPSLKYYLTRGIKAEASVTGRGKTRRGGRPKKAAAESAPASVETNGKAESVPTPEPEAPKTTPRRTRTTARTAAKQAPRTASRSKTAAKDSAGPKKSPGRPRKKEA